MPHTTFYMKQQLAAWVELTLCRKHGLEHSQYCADDVPPQISSVLWPTCNICECVKMQPLCSRLENAQRCDGASESKRRGGYVTRGTEHPLAVAVAHTGNARSGFFVHSSGDFSCLAVRPRGNEIWQTFSFPRYQARKTVELQKQRDGVRFKNLSPNPGKKAGWIMGVG